jgi:4-hydroxybenzoate polyprenyltransferase
MTQNLNLERRVLHLHTPKQSEMKNYLSLIKFSHTVFALPFALVGFFLANAQTGQSPSLLVLTCIILCMIFARSAAMAFNRYLDRDIDAQNPRTAIREIPAGLISPKAAFSFVLMNILGFIATTWFINPLCFYLSPVALAVILGYSYTKRFTWLCHFVLGLGLSLAPIGAYLAVTGQFDIVPLLYSMVVLFWVSGFDIIYALQDEEFDKSLRLNSIPVFLGKQKALRLSSVLHILCAAVLIYSVWMVSTTEDGTFGILHLAGTAIFIGLLIYQHTLVKAHDLSKVNLAFFTTNGIASVIYGSFFILDFFI